MHQLNFNSLTTASASKMTYIVSSGALNSTHSLTHSACSTCWNSSNGGTPDVTATLCTADSSIMSQTEKIEPSHWQSLGTECMFACDSKKKYSNHKHDTTSDIALTSRFHLPHRQRTISNGTGTLQHVSKETGSYGQYNVWLQRHSHNVT